MLRGRRVVGYAVGGRSRSPLRFTLKLFLFFALVGAVDGSGRGAFMSVLLSALLLASVSGIGRLVTFFQGRSWPPWNTEEN